MSSGMTYQNPMQKMTDEAILKGASRLLKKEQLLYRLNSDNTRDLIAEYITPEKHADLEHLEEKLSDESSMIELHLDLKFKMKPWKKALAFSFLFYLIILFMLIVIITFIRRDFDPKLVLMISGIYLTALTLSFRYMYKVFKKKFSSST